GHHRRDHQRERRAHRAHAQARSAVVLWLVVPRAGAGARLRILRHAPPLAKVQEEGEGIMNVRGAALQSGLAALGLVAAYTTWQREPERAPGEVVVLDVNKGDVKQIRFDDGAGKWVELERRSEPGLDEPRVWLKLAKNEK